MSRSMLACALAFLLLAPTGAAQLFEPAGRGVVVNLHFAEEDSCSDDPPGTWFFSSGPDFEVVVWHEGSIVHQTGRRQDSHRPEFRTYVELPDLSRPATLSFELREHEPPEEGGPFYECDLASGSATRFDITVGSTSTAFDTRGGGERAARLVGKVGPLDAPRPAPAILTLEEATPHSLTFTWQKAPGEIVTRQHLRSFFAGNEELLPTATRHTVEGLRERWPHDFVLMREGDGWSVLSPEVSFSTTAAPPAAPGINVTGGYEEINVTWVTDGRATRAEVHVSPNASFTPTAQTLRHVGGSSGMAQVREPAVHQSRYVLVVAQGDGGWSPPSEIVHVVAQQRPAPPPPTDVVVEQHHDRIALSWAAPPVAGVEKHEIRWGNTTLNVPMPMLGASLETLVPGANYTIRVRAVNTNGLFTDAAPLHVVFAPPNEMPIVAARFATEKGRAGERLTLAVEARDPDGDPLRFVVDWGDGVEEETTATLLEHVYARAGDYEALVRTVDHLGGAATARASIAVAANAPPLPRLDVDRGALAVGDVLWADASASSDEEGDALSFQYDWGDGTSTLAAGAASHSYDRSGRFLLVATVTDALGARASISQEIRVEAAQASPPRTSPAPTVTAPASADPRPSPAAHAAPDEEVAPGSAQPRPTPAPPSAPPAVTPPSAEAAGAEEAPPAQTPAPAAIALVALLVAFVLRTRKRGWS